MNNSSSRARQLGREVEWRVVDAFNHNGITARHAKPDEDLHQGWDVEFAFHGFTVQVDLTISRAQLCKKQNAEPIRNGLVVAVLVDPDWSEEELFRETIRQVVYSLPDWVKRALLKELTS